MSSPSISASHERASRARLPTASQLTQLAAACAWLAAAVSLLRRLPIGTSNRDEAFYSAMPYSFLLGNRPYVDELALHQNAGILLVPFFRAYLAIVGSADGIVLFNRYLYFAYASISSVLAYRLVRRLCDRATACCVGALVVSFSYYNIFALSYNSCGAFGFLCGVLCCATALLSPRPGPLLFVASLFLLSAMFSYPGIAPAVLVELVLVLFWLKRKLEPSARSSALLGIFAGVALTVAVVAGFGVWLGSSGLQRLLVFSQGMGYGTRGLFAKLNYFRSDAWLWHWALLAFAGLFVAQPLACRWFSRAPWVVALLTALGFAGCCQLTLHLIKPTGATICLTALPLLAPACLALHRSWQYRGFVLQLLWTPAVLSMLCIVYSSANAFQSASLGVLGALVAGVASLSSYLSAEAQRNPEHRYGYALVFAALIGPLLFTECYSLYQTAYDDAAAVAAHDTRVNSGPMRGAIATAQQARFLEAVDHDLKQVQTGASTLTVFDGFATGYLSTRLKPRTFTQWIIWSMNPHYTRSIVKETFGTPDKLPDLLLETNVDQGARHYWQKYFEHHYKTIVNRADLHYRILRKSPL